MHAGVLTDRMRPGARATIALIVAAVVAAVLVPGTATVVGQAPGAAPPRGGTLRIARPQAPIPPC